MAFVSILKIPDSDELRVVSSEERIAPDRFVTEEGTFAERIDPVVFEREVPNPQVLLQESREVLASSKVNGAADTFLCPAPIVIRAVEVARLTFVAHKAGAVSRLPALLHDPIPSAQTHVPGMPALPQCADESELGFGVRSATGNGERCR